MYSSCIANLNFGTKFINHCLLKFSNSRLCSGGSTSIPFSVVYLGFRGWGGGSREQWGGVFLTLEKAKFSRFSNLKIFKNVKKSMKNYNYLKIVKESLRFFENFIQILPKI